MRLRLLPQDTEDCRCEDVVACFDGKAFDVEVIGVEDEILDCCSDLNTTYPCITIHNTGINGLGQCSLGASGGGEVACFAPWCVGVIVNLNMGCDYAGIGVWMIAFSPESSEIGSGVSLGRYQISDEALARDAIYRLCDGETVAIPLQADHGTLCDLSGSSVLISLASDLCEPDECVNEPPPPPAEDCDGLDECEDPTEAFLDLNFTDGDYDEALTEHLVFGPGVTGTAHWLLSNLNTSFNLSMNGGVYDYELELYTPTGTHATAVADGILIRQDDINDGGGTTDGQYEAYVYKIELGFECTDGSVTIEYIKFYYEQFYGSNETVAWPTGNGTSDFTLIGVLITDHILEGNASACRSGPTYCKIEWEDDGTDLCIFNPQEGSDHLAFAMGQIDLL